MTRPGKQPARILRSGTIGGTVSLAMVLAVLAMGCTRVEPHNPGGSTIETDAFVEAIVALRTSFAVDDQGVLVPGAGDAILQERELTAEDLETFVEVHGGNVPFMTDVWARVQEEVDRANGATDAADSDLEADSDR